MRTCVIGGAGFIGSHFVASLLRTGRDVTMIGRTQRPSTPKAQFVVASSPESRVALAEADEVIDLSYSSTPKTSFQDPLRDIRENLTPSVDLFQFLLNSRAQRVLVVSTGGAIYGQQSSLPISETAPTNPISPYGITKLAIEKYALMFHRTHGLPILVARPANAYGEGQRPGLGQGFVATAAAKALKSEAITVFGETGTVRDYVHVTDVASALMAVLERGTIGETYNVGSGIGLTNRQMLEAMAEPIKRAGGQVVIEVAPSRPFDVSANVLDSRKLNEATGWSCAVPIKEGLQRTIDWLCTQ